MKKKLKLLTWVAYVALILVLAACSDDDETASGLPTYTVTVTATANGVATADPATCEAGETVTLTATPDEGFLFVKWTVKSGEVILADATANPAKITMPNGDVAIEASFADEFVSSPVKVATVENGSVKACIGGEEIAEALEGAAVTLTATPDEGYEFAGWMVTGVEIAAADLTKNPLTFTMPAAEVEITAAFKKLVNVLEMITDATFKAYVQRCMNMPEEGEIDGESVVQPKWDINQDGILSEKEAAAVEFIDLNTYCNQILDEDFEYITSLAGIEYFTGIKKLDISGYLIEDDDCSMVLDLANCGELVEFKANDCGYGLSEIILGEKPNLKFVDLDLCSELTAIDFENCPKLEVLTLMSNDIGQVVLNNSPLLKKLELKLPLESIDLSANTELMSLTIKSESLTTLDISRQTKLTYLACSACKLSVMDITKMAFNADNTYTAYVGYQGDPFKPLELEELKMRADQKKHWDEVLTGNIRNSRIKKVTVID